MTTLILITLIIILFLFIVLPLLAFCFIAKWFTKLRAVLFASLLARTKGNKK